MVRCVNVPLSAIDSNLHLLSYVSLTFVLMLKYHNHLGASVKIHKVLKKLWNGCSCEKMDVADIVHCLFLQSSAV